MRGGRNQKPGRVAGGPSGAQLVAVAGGRVTSTASEGAFQALLDEFEPDGSCYGRLCQCGVATNEENAIFQVNSKRRT